MKPAVKRCAIYTRKSSEEGLEQAFNSLDAQREACAAYVLSQAGEGWQASPKLYDDGGFSGGNIERPALKALLADVDAGRIDVIVVYKVDRLTRSLADFAKIVDRLDAAGASFVSVTQAFNTTNSMGRLTLNVLLSFAQFEREVTGERIRDKIALSKAKGMWMGGTLPLGYDVKDRKLVVNEAEAETVRHIFQRYLELKSVHALRDELNAAGYRSKIRVTAAGRQLGGVEFNRGSLYHLLQSRLYLGEIPHRDKHHPGQHDAIVSQDVFDAVQAQIVANRQTAKERPVRSAQCALIGKVFDAAGGRMSPSFGYGKQGKLYRYYVSTAVLVGAGKANPCAVPRVSAEAVETFVGGILTRLVGPDVGQQPQLAELVKRLEIHPDHFDLVIDANAVGNSGVGMVMKTCVRKADASEDIAWRDQRLGLIEIRVPVRLRLRGGRTTLDGAAGLHSGRQVDKSLVQALRHAHRSLFDLGTGPTNVSSEMVAGAAPTCPYQRRLSAIPFLSPEVQQQILNGRHSAEIDMNAVTRGDMPLAWADQAAWLAQLAI